jgi:hypothetical protein
MTWWQLLILCWVGADAVIVLLWITLKGIARRRDPLAGTRRSVR